MAEYIAIQREAEAQRAREARRERERRQQEGNDNDNDNDNGNEGNGGSGSSGGGSGGGGGGNTQASDDRTRFFVSINSTADLLMRDQTWVSCRDPEHLPTIVRTILCALLTLGSDGEDGYGAGIHVQITKMQDNNTAGRYRGQEGERRLNEVARDMAGANVRPERRLRFEAGSAEERQTMMMLLMELVSGGIGAFD